MSKRFALYFLGAILFVATVYWLTGCHEPKTTQVSRYVVIAKDVHTTRATLEEAKKYLGGMTLSDRGVKDLRYHKGFVAKITEKQAGEVAVKFGLGVFKDTIAKANLACAPAPRPIPDPGPVEQPPQSIPWGITAVRAKEAWAVTKGKGVLVCVVDTGIQSRHPDLCDEFDSEGRCIKSAVSVGEDFTGTGSWEDDAGHGTHVGGTIAARDNSIGVVGVAPEASLGAMKVLDAQGSGYMSDVADGITACVQAGADIVNLSLGASEGDPLTEKAVRDAISAGVLVIAAAGNDGGPVGYPAKYAGAYAISATDIYNRLAYFSNRGPEIAVTAPGVDVESCIPGSDYDVFSGTSMATPHVAGVAALMIASGHSILKASNIGLPKEHQGAGIVNAQESVK